MEYRHLGKSGLEVSALSFGSWVTFGDQVADTMALDCMTAAHEAGVNFFDNAEVYAGGKSESVMGEVLKKVGWDRRDIVISTKIFWGGPGPNRCGLSRKHVIEGMSHSLQRLGLDYVDLVFCHRPDVDTPVEETVRAMNYLIEQGKTFYWGTSEWNRAQIQAAYHIARRERLIPPTMEQPEYNMLNRDKVEKDFAPLYEEMGLGTTIFSPLAGGILTGKYAKGLPKDSRVHQDDLDWFRKSIESPKGQEKIRKVKNLEPLAKELGCTMAQLALAWCLKNPNVSTVITGASKVEQVESNMKAMDVVEKIDSAMMARIEDILDNKPGGEARFK
jgi:voltage-dependent potassium channel beta subunit